MARNIEIKAKAKDLERLAKRAADLADSGPEIVRQEDTFFRCPDGRLKLRAFPDGTGQLIYYRRPDAAGAKTSEYVVVPAANVGRLGQALSAALGVQGLVRKTRTVYFVGHTRIHLDDVDGLGEFIELEVVLGPNESPEAGAAVAERLMNELEIEPGDLIECSYVDLLTGDLEEQT